MKALHFVTSRLKRAAYALVLAVARSDKTGARERRTQEMLAEKLGANRNRLRSVAWYSEQNDDLAMAVVTWRRLARNLARKSPEDSLRAVQRGARNEIELRRRIESAAPEMGRIIPHAPVLPVRGADPADAPLTPYLLKTRHEFLQTFWAQIVRTLPSREKADLRKCYLDLARKWASEGQYRDAMLALQPLLATWPADQVVYRQLFQAVIDQVTKGAPDAQAMLDAWWTVFDDNRASLTPDTLDHVWGLSERTARRFISGRKADLAEAVISPAFRRWPDNHIALAILAQAASLRGEFSTAAAHWQLLAALTNPVTTKTQTHVAVNPEEMLRKSRYALNELRTVRFKLAHELHARGRTREFAELVSRAVETIPDQRVFKKERLILDAVRKYVQDALKSDGVQIAGTRSLVGKPKRIAICLDILKLSDLHTHSRVVFAICRNLMALDPEIETHIIVTNERFVVTTPIVNASFNPNSEEQVIAVARAAMPEEFGKRFFLHNFLSTGLEGLIETCKEIVKIDPDVILYGGGHRGLFSNESRAVRHCLYDHYASAFIYIQANNEVDDKLDMIIARGPHEIIGENGHGKVKVQVQPYPTIVEPTIEVKCEPEKQKNAIIVSAISGVRMDQKMKELPEADLAQFLTILDKCPGTVWHLIGAADPAALIAANRLIAKRVKAGQMVVHPVLPFEEFVGFVGGKASLFLHLPGFTGGSGGATVARRAGVPILTFAHSDVSGRQPAETVFGPADIGKYVATAVRLLRSPKDWERVVRLQFAHTNWIRETSAKAFYDVVCEASLLGKSRLESRVVAIPGPKPGRPGEKPSLTVVKNSV